MATTVNQVIQFARSSINDPANRRISQVEAVSIFNRTLGRLFTERPDIFIGALDTEPAVKALSDNVPYEDQFAQVHADMIAAEVNLISDAEGDAGKATAFDNRSRR